MTTFKSLCREFWLPLSAAVAWTAYALHSTAGPLTPKTVITTFGPAFFLVSWATGQVIRVRRQSHVESGLRGIQSRLEALLTQIETRTTDLLGQITGGSSYCFLQLLWLSGEGHGPEILVQNPSAHPVFDAVARIVDLEALTNMHESGSVRLEACESYVHVPMLTAAHATRRPGFALGDSTVRGFNIFWSARNGDWFQLLRFAKVNGHWQQAIRVVRDDKILYEQLQQDFPIEALGGDWKNVHLNGTLATNTTTDK
jgi:hypothetical protein